MSSLRLVLGVVAAVTLLAWGTGRLVSDRFIWSQWLLWIPTPVAIVACGLGLPSALRPAPRRRARIGSWLGVTALIIVYFSAVEHRLLGRAPATTGGVRLLHWNVNHGPRAKVEPMARWIVALDPQVAILTHAGRVPWTPTLRRWLGESRRPFQIGIFTIVSRFPILEARHIAAVDEASIAFIRIDTGAAGGGPLVIYMINMPSDPRVARAELARRARELMVSSDAPPPDLIVGDLNMTRGSAALSILCPGFRHAYDEAGHGYGATFRRGLPLYHIDHVLLSEPLRAQRYELFDPGVTRHLIQVAEVMRDEPG